MEPTRSPREAAPTADSAAGSPRRYRVELLEAPQLGEEGIEHLCEGRPSRLPWHEIELAIAAEVGEPQGVRIIVFDLVCRRGGEWVARRLDAEPGEEAAAVARSLDAALGDAARPSIKSLATDGVPSRWYPDLESLEESILGELPENP